MSALEDKLRSLAFREPPQDLRRQVLGAVARPALRPTWRDWLWPSPLAWGALAAVWLIAFATETPGTGRSSDDVVDTNEPPVALFALSTRYQQDPEIGRLLAP